MPNVFTPPLQPSIGSGTSWSARLIENQFGDGYRQTALDGLNAIVGTLTLSWDLLTLGQADYIDAFIRQNVGKPFYWAGPSTAYLLWDCKAWTRNSVEGAGDKITATFVQRFDPV